MRVPFPSTQYRVCIICFLVTFLDGFDLTVVGVALPKIAGHLSTDPASLGLALSAGQFGPLVGAIVMGMSADRWGRKWMLFLSAILFGGFTLLTVQIKSVEQLALYRFLAGIGLGGAVPNALTLGSEYAPQRSRGLIVAAMYAGMRAGAMTGGLLAAYLIPHSGWQALFLFSGSAPLAISLLVAFALPESLEFLVRRNTGTDSEKARRIIAKIAPWLATNRDIEFVATDKKRPGAAFTRLFTDGRGVTTLLLWLVCSGALYLLWILNTWSPTLLRNSGATVQQYSLAYAFLCFGAVVSSVCIGRLVDSFKPFAMLQVGFFLAALSLVAFGLGASSGSFVIIALLSVICGICINGSQTGTLAIATLAYPTDIRATGIGWAYAIAKIGAMLAPLAGGYMLGRGWSVAQLCNVDALVGIFIVGVLMLLRQRVARSIEEAGKR